MNPITLVLALEFETVSVFFLGCKDLAPNHSGVDFRSCGGVRCSVSDATLGAFAVQGEP